MKPRLLVACPAVVLASVLAGCSPDSPSRETADDQVEEAAIVIDVTDNRFTPTNAEVDAGALVAWDFSAADLRHNVVFDTDRMSDPLDSGTWTTTFDEPGTYAYECTLHADMDATITVVDA